MNERAPLRRIVLGILADVDDYARLHGLLEAQFEAAIRHDTARIGSVGAEIVALAESLGARREERVSLAGRITDAQGEKAMAAVFAQMPEGVRAMVAPAWQNLERAVRECKALNTRNCRLLMDQHEIMQRVLETEADTYVPV